MPLNLILLPKCQKADWPCHKLLCSHFKTNNERPSPKHRRAILFPEGHLQDSSPQLIWIEVEEKFEDYEDGFFWELPLLEKHMGRSLGSLGRSEFERNLIRRRKLSKVVEVWMRDNFFSDGSLPNESIKKSTRGAARHDWRGPLVVLKYIGLGGMYMGNGKYDDMNLRDFRDTADFFLGYPFSADEQAAFEEDSV
ncbi:hypothetical protein G7Y79_00003g012220 [Physcia stellaris]|nr:hypothetical protein G7Y79_00003g012220 [Physcia stellaris]